MVALSTQFVLAAATLASFVTAAPQEARSQKPPGSVAIRRPKAASRPVKDLIEREKARGSSFKSSKASGTAPVINGDVSYYADTTVGSQTFTLIVDTGSSNTWVGADKKFTKGSAKSTGDKVSVSYGSGSFSGTEYTDSVSLGGLTASSQSIGVASTSTGFSGVDGIIGFGPEDLTEDTVDGENTVPTFLETLVSEGVISSNVLGVSFAPESGSSTDSDNGELDLGGVDSSKYSGDIAYVDVTSTSPYSDYWGIKVSSIKYDSTSVSSSADAIVDTGTTLIYIPSSAYDKLLSASGGKTDSNSGLSSWSKKPTSDVTFTIGGAALTLTPSQYLIPTDQYSFFGVESGKYYGWFVDGGSEAADVNFIIGQKFLENYYAVFDTDNSRVGFATSTA